MVELDQGGRLAGRAGLRAAPPELSEWVEHSFVLRTAGEVTRSWRIVPDLSSHLLVHFHEDDEGPDRARISGSRTRWVDARVRSRTFSVGLRFRPGALAALSGELAATLTDRSIPAAELKPAETDRLFDRIGRSNDPEFVRRAILKWAEESFAGSRPPDWRATTFCDADADPECRSIEDRGRAMGLGYKTLYRACLEHVGLTPKRMLRIQRSFRAIQAAVRRPEMSGGWVAAYAGYTDQSHMTRDFHDLLGEAPGRFFERRRAG